MSDEVIQKLVCIVSRNLKIMMDSRCKRNVFSPRQFTNNPKQYSFLTCRHHFSSPRILGNRYTYWGTLQSLVESYGVHKHNSVSENRKHPRNSASRAGSPRDAEGHLHSTKRIAQ
jgi:hypothetical protein